MPSLTIVVPARNGAATLGRCLAALVRAVPAGARIVVVDDASEDDTARIAAGFPVRVVAHPERRGASGARNTGIAAEPADVYGFVDADVVVRDDAITRLLARLDREPDAFGVNGILGLDLSTPGLMAAFANTSIHFQHLRHGHRVATAFTSLCLLRREALERMGGWDERTSRFADDVATRWYLPPRSIVLETGATGDHLKRVSLRGLLRHRYQIGYHFVSAVAAHWGEVRRRPGVSVVGWRYPINTLAAALTLGFVPIAVWAPEVLLLPILLFVGANASFAAFTARVRPPVEALLAIPVSALEGFAYLSGIAASATLGVGRRR